MRLPCCGIAKDASTTTSIPTQKNNRSGEEWTADLLEYKNKLHTIGQSGQELLIW